MFTSTTNIVDPSFVPGVNAVLSCKPATLPANNNFLSRSEFLIFFLSFNSLRYLKTAFFCFFGIFLDLFFL